MNIEQTNERTNERANEWANERIILDSIDDNVSAPIAGLKVPDSFSVSSPSIWFGVRMICDSE